MDRFSARSAGLLAMLFWACQSGPGQTRYNIQTVAGHLPEDDGGPAVEALLVPAALAIGPDGSVYVSSSVAGIRRITPDGLIRRNGAASATSFKVDDSGTIHYVNGSLELYRYSQADGTGTGIRPDYGSVGLRSAPAFTSIALDSAGDVVLADGRNLAIWRITPAGVPSLLAGGPSAVRLAGVPERIAIDSENRIYIAQSNRRVVRLNPDGTLESVAGSGQVGDPVAGPAVESPLNSISQLELSPTGELFIVSFRTVAKVTREGKLEIVVSGPVMAGIGFHPGTAEADLLFAESDSNRVWRLNPDGSHSLVAERVWFAGDGGPATQALLRSPRAVAVAADGSLLIADTLNARVRRVDADGTIETVAGTGEYLGPPAVGPARETRIYTPSLMAAAGETLYFASNGGNTIFRLTASGVVELVAGDGTSGFSGDGGPARDARLSGVAGLATDRDGNLFLSDRSSNRIRKVDVADAIPTIAGNGTLDPGPDDTPAAEATVALPQALDVAPDGRLVFFESGRNRLRRIGADGRISTVTPVSFADGPAQRCQLTGINALRFDPEGGLWLASGASVCRLSPDGVMHLMAGGPA